MNHCTRGTRMKLPSRLMAIIVPMLPLAQSGKLRMPEGWRVVAAHVSDKDRRKSMPILERLSAMPGGKLVASPT
jgi:hypothetical protein